MIIIFVGVDEDVDLETHMKDKKSVYVRYMGYICKFNVVV